MYVSLLTVNTPVKQALYTCSTSRVQKVVSMNIGICIEQRANDYGEYYSLEK